MIGRRDRRPPVPRGHRLGALRGPLVRRRQDLAGRPRHPRRDARRRRRRRHRRQALRHRARRRRHVRGAGAAARPGDRALGQLVQPGAVRPRRPTLPWALEIDDQHLPAGLRRPAPRSTRRSSTSRCGTSGCAGSCCGSTTGGSCAAGACSGCTSVATASAGLVVESLRIDPAHEIAGLRVNQWVAIVCDPRRLRLRRLGDRRRRPVAPRPACPGRRASGKNKPRSTQTASPARA